MKLREASAILLAALMLTPPPAAIAASHREAPITALDRTADITDWYAFVSYDDPTKVTMILNVDPFLEPSNGPNYFPFDPDVLYEMHVDNNRDGVEDITFRFRFQTEQRLPGVFTAYVGAGQGLSAPGNSPAPVKPGTPIIPPAVTALDGPGSEGLGVRQTYTVSMVRNGVETFLGRLGGGSLIAVPSNVGPRTMPNYPTLAASGIYQLEQGVKVFAGTVDDPFFIDLGAAFDSLNFRFLPNGTGVPAVLTPDQDRDDTRNVAPDAVAGFNVNSIAIEVPIALLTQKGNIPAATDADATIGTYGQTSRQRTTVRRSPNPMQSSGNFRPVQRMGNPLVNELLIGTGSKDRFSMSDPKDDSQFAGYLLDPLIARAFNAIYGNALPVPAAPRNDLLPLVQYMPPISSAGPKGPVADLLRLNVAVPPTPKASRKRLGLIAGDAAGYPNGRRVSDDVTDISMRAVAGVLTGDPRYTGAPHNILGDGVNTNDVPYQETFPYVAFAQSGRSRVHDTGPAQTQQ